MRFYWRLRHAFIGHNWVRYTDYIITSTNHRIPVYTWVCRNCARVERNYIDRG